jgi:chromosome partitioning protein
LKVIAIISQKGGAGKTTLAINLAGAAEAEGLSTVIIDLDPQASAYTWGKVRGRESPVIQFIQHHILNDAIATAKKAGADLLIIDTAPHSERGALAAAKAADLVLIPCRASALDLHAIAASVEIVEIARSPAAMFVINCVRPGDKSLPNEAETALQKHEIPVCPLRITLRSDCIHALSSGQSIVEFSPDGAAADEIRQLFKLCFHQEEKKTSHQKEGATA